MKDFFRTTFPGDNRETRERLYHGEVFLAEASAASRAMADDAEEALARILELDEPRLAHRELAPEVFFERMGKLRRHIYLGERFHEHIREVVRACGFDPAAVAFDPARIRVVLPGGHRNPRAAPVYYAHRDTWYAHPQSLIVWWIPLHDVAPEETFVFYPDRFDREVANDSEIFDYGDWVKDGPELKIGWQDKDSGKTAGYPQALESRDPATGIGFSARRAQPLVFAGAHYHQTLPHDRDKVRYSLDFRVVVLEDERAGRGAPNADNRSRGSCLDDYLRPPSSSPAS